LGGGHPNQTAHQTLFSGVTPKLDLLYSKSGISLMSEDSHLFSTVKDNSSMSSYSKAPGVFLSWCNKAASSQPLQFRQVDSGDSCFLVMPFVHVWTYQTRNFATIEQL